MEGITESNIMIEKTVIEILKNSKMDETTEFEIRKIASEKLNMDLSTSHYKMFVRSVVENYLSQQTNNNNNEDEKHNNNNNNNEDEKHNNNNNNNNNENKDKEYDDIGDLIICRLSDKKRVTIQDFKGKTLVSLREYYKKDGKELPSAKGISLTTEQWATFKKNVPAIQKAIVKMESRLH